MPRWTKEPAPLGVQTFVMVSSRQTLIDGGTEKEEVEAAIRQAQLQLDQFYKQEVQKRRRVVDLTQRVAGTCAITTGIWMADADDHRRCQPQC
jgi:hypothetical protein